MSVQMQQGNFYDTNQTVLRQTLMEYFQEKGQDTFDVQTIITNYERGLAREGWSQQELSQIQPPQQKSKSAQG